VKTIQKLALLLCACPALLLATETAPVDKADTVKQATKQELTKNNPQVDQKPDGVVQAPKKEQKPTKKSLPTADKQTPAPKKAVKPLSKQPKIENPNNLDSSKKDLSEEQALAELEKMFRQMEAEEAQKKAAVQETDKNSNKETNKAALVNLAAKKADTANKSTTKEVELT
jgi:hypothetical protein